MFDHFGCRGRDHRGACAGPIADIASSWSQRLGRVEVWIGMVEPSDAELLAGSQRDPEAFAMFYRRHERLVAGWLMRETRDGELAADLTAEVFAAAYLAAAKFRSGPEPAGAWLLGIARNKLLHSRRRDRVDTSARRRLSMERVELSQQSISNLEQLGAQRASELLSLLPVEQQTAVRGRVIDDLSYDELASRERVSPAAARKRVSRGLATLRRLLGQPGGLK